LVNIRGAIEEIGLVYSTSLTKRIQRNLVEFTSLAAGFVVLTSDSPWRYIAVIWLAIIFFGFPIIFLGGLSWKKALMYGFSCRRLQDRRREVFRDLSVRRHDSVVFKSWIHFPLGASSWRLRFSYPTGIVFEERTLVAGDFDYDHTPNNTTLRCSKPSYTKVSLEFKVKVPSDLPLDMLVIEVFCARNHKRECQIKTIRLHVDP